MTHPHNSVSRKRPKHLKIRALGAATIAMALLAGSTAAVATDKQPEPQNIQQIMQQQIKLMKPELQQKVQALSPDTKKSLMKILAMHTRYSETATLRQVMNEVLSDYQSMVAGIMTENSEQAADSALRLANHRIPVGGLLPYMGMENISDERLAILEGFNDSVEGNAKKLAAAAKSGDLAQAASLLAPISAGCVACHAVFRGQPGRSNLLR